MKRTVVGKMTQIRVLVLGQPSHIARIIRVDHCPHHWITTFMGRMLTQLIIVCQRITFCAIQVFSQ